MSERKGLRAVTRVALATASVLVLGVLALSIVSYATVSRGIIADLDRNLAEECKAYSAVLDQKTPTTTQQLIDISKAYLAAREPGGTRAPILLVRLVDGSVVSNSDVTLEKALSTTSSASAAGFMTVQYAGAQYRVATCQVTSVDGTPLATFHAALSLDAVHQTQRDLSTALAAIGFSIVLLGGLFSYWVARAALMPLTKVAATASMVTESRLTERIPYDGPDDELGTMVRSLNAMLARLESAFEEQKRFVADASHELRTPLAIMRGNVDLIDRGDLDEAEREEALSALRDEIRRMERLVDDLLTLARADSKALRRPFQPLDAGVLLHEVAARVYVLGERTVTVHAQPGLWILGDPDLLEQALSNVVRNAARHTSPNGRIALSSRAERDRVLLTIADDGPGIPEEELLRVFDRFYRGAGSHDDSSSGGGLGLAIAKQLVELHGGTIRAENGPEGGAVFTLELPRIDSP